MYMTSGARIKDLVEEGFTPFANRPMVICGLEPKEVWFDSTGPISFWFSDLFQIRLRLVLCAASLPMPAGISGFVSKVPACFFIMTGSLRIHTPDSIFRTSPLQRPLPTTRVASFSLDSGTGHSDMREDAWKQ